MYFRQLDISILTYLTSLAGKCPSVDYLIGMLTYYDTLKGAAVMTILWFTWFYRDPKETAKDIETRQQNILITYAGSLGAVALARTVQKSVFVHLRPALDHLGLAFPTFPDSMPLNSWSSFPSDHTVLFVALATGLWRVNRVLSLLVYVWAIVIISFPRIYLGIHYPSDVAGGIILGIIIMKAFELLPLRKVAQRVLAWRDHHPGLFYGAAFFMTEQLGHLFDDVRYIASELLHKVFASI